MIGFMVDVVEDNSEQYAMFRSINQLSQMHECYLFSNTVLSLPIQNHFAILQQVEAMDHKGILVGTSLFTAQMIANCLTCTDKYYYLLYPEWTSLSGFGSSQLNVIFHHEEMELITKSNSHAKLVGDLFKQPKGVVYNWDVEQLKKVLKI